MTKKLITKVIGTGIVLFACFNFVKAQSFTITNEPMSPAQLAEMQSPGYLNIDNQKVDELNPGQRLDDQKFAAWKANGFTTAETSNPAEDPDLNNVTQDPATADAAARKGMKDAVAASEAADHGYLAVPGFTWQDQDRALNDQAFESALQAFFADEAAQQALEASDPTLFSEIMQLNN